MRRRLSVATAVAVCGMLFGPPIAFCQSAPASPAQAAQPPPIYAPTSLVAEPGLPRTPDGRPDLQDVVWAANFFPMLEASPLAPTLVMPEADAKRMLDMIVTRLMASDDPNVKTDPEVHQLIGETRGLPLVRGERRSRMIVLPADGKLPMTAEARREIAGVDPLGGPMDNPEQRPASERCVLLDGPPPISSTLSYTRFRIVQTPAFVVINTENGDEARIIPFAARHGSEPHSRYGDGIARWEGDTLVIETVNLPAETRVRNVPRLIVNPEATVVEKFTRLSRDELLYQYTVVDPNVYTAPWLAEYSLYAADTGMFPGSCHEANYSLPNILKGARVAEERARR